MNTLHSVSTIVERHPRTFARLWLSVAVTVMLFASSAARAELVKIIVPAPAGSAIDTLARVLAEQIGRTQKLTIVVGDRPGASTEVGTEAASRAAPDGNTLLLVGTNFVINPHLRRLPYDPLTSFEPICRLVTSPIVIVVNSQSPYRTLADWLEAARRKPGELTLGSIGPASTAHIAFEMLKRKANVNMTFVPFPGTPPAVSAVLGQHTTAYFGNYSDVSGQINSGALRALATLSPRRIEPLPDVPTLAELGYPLSLSGIWFGIVVPAGTPMEVRTRLAGWFTDALHVDDVAVKLTWRGLYPATSCGAEFGSFLRREFDEYGRAIRESGISVH